MFHSRLDTFFLKNGFIKAFIVKVGLKVASSIDFHEIMHTSDAVSVRTAVGKEIGTYFIFRARHKRIYFLELHYKKNRQKSVSILKLPASPGRGLPLQPEPSRFIG